MLQIHDARIVIDTNLWVSYFLGSETRERLHQILFDENLIILVSEALLIEISTVLGRSKFRKFFPKSDAEELDRLIRLRSELIDTHSVISYSRDKKDDFVLALCRDGKADYLLTGDVDLLVLNPFEDTQILRLTAFWNAYAQ